MLAGMGVAVAFVLPAKAPPPPPAQPAAARNPPPEPQAAEGQKMPQREKKFVKMSERIFTRGFPIGEVLLVKLGLDKERLLALPPEFDKERFTRWLMETDKKVVTISRLRVPKLRPERPILDGQDIYEGFFAPAPGMLDLYAPREGSISKLKKQGCTFLPEELAALDAMLRRCLAEEVQGRLQWQPLPVGSRMAITSGKAPRIEIWVNQGEQLPSVDETIAKARLAQIRAVSITDPLEIQALNKHYNYSMIVEDEDIKAMTEGKYSRTRDRLFDLVKDKKYDPEDAL